MLDLLGKPKNTTPNEEFSIKVNLTYFNEIKYQ